jgi:hypothetical protein
MTFSAPTGTKPIKCATESTVETVSGLAKTGVVLD